MLKPFKILLALALCTTAFSVFATSNSDDAFSQTELDQLLAPIALYPDTVLSHLLIAATYPLEVVEAERWAKAHQDLDGEEALLAAELEDWDPSVIALVPFPHILQRMSEDLKWTRQVGEAFLQAEVQVLDTIQALRQRAYDEGNLNSSEYQEVSRDEGHIVIEPVRREVVYVPYYDTRVVYGAWWWPHHPPHFWSHHAYYGPSHGVHYTGHFVWTPSLHISTGIFFSSFHWHSRHVVVIDRRHRHAIRYGRQVVHHRQAQPWAHNPYHRRGVTYRSPSVARRYTAVSAPYRTAATHRTPTSHAPVSTRPASVQRRNQLLDDMHHSTRLGPERNARIDRNNHPNRAASPNRVQPIRPAARPASPSEARSPRLPAQPAEAARPAQPRAERTQNAAPQRPASPQRNATAQRSYRNNPALERAQAPRNYRTAPNAHPRSNQQRATNSNRAPRPQR